MFSKVLCSKKGGEIGFGVESTCRNVRAWRSLWGGLTGVGVWVMVVVGPGGWDSFIFTPPSPELPAPGKCDRVWMPDSRGALESGGCSSDLFQR